jgi:hypothetical protein
MAMRLNGLPLLLERDWTSIGAAVGFGIPHRETGHFA